MTKKINTTVEVPRKFNFFTGILKAAGGDGEPMTLSGVASSTVEDLHGDKIERTALKDMEAAVANGMTIFLNHSYNVPEDVAGYAEAARVKKRGADDEGNGIWDLDIDLTINDENPRAVEAWKGIKGGKWKAGLSIGANIPEDGFDYDRSTGKITINHIQLLETSIVGIPANQRSWISKALTALEPVIEAEKDAPETHTITVEEDITITIEEDGPEAVEAAEIEDAPPADARDEEPDVQEDGEDEVEAGAVDYDEKEQAPEPEKTDDAEPDAETPATPVVEESTDADPSTVESVDEDGDPDPEAMLASLTEVEGEVTLTHLQSAVQVGVKLAERITTLTKERDAARKAQAAAEADRDQAIKYAAEAVSVAKDVGSLPVGRKADKAKIQKNAASVARRFSDIYPPDFLKMLEKHSD